MIFRVARHTNNLNPIIEFYCNILNLEILGRFENHNNYAGVFLGKNDLDWHLEFTKSNEEANHKFDDDDILVFYPRTRDDYNNILENIKTYEIQIKHTKNPYWNENGIMIQDPDGYNVVVCNLKSVKTNSQQYKN